MQMSVPDATDISKEPQKVLDMYGPDVQRPGSFARHCLLARRFLERGVRYVQLFHAGWDQHQNLPTQLEVQCRDTDQPSAALVKDLEQRGLLDDTLVIWGGEFGRTVFCQGDPTAKKYGRDHHPRASRSGWRAAASSRARPTARPTSSAYGVVKDRVDAHDFQATILHLLGIDHKRLTFKYQGRHFRLTDVQRQGGQGDPGVTGVPKSQPVEGGPHPPAPSPKGEGEPEASGDVTPMDMPPAPPPL